MHKFTPTATVRTKCDVCGKTRNAAAHRNAGAAAAEAVGRLTPAQVEAARVADAQTEPESTVTVWVGWRIADAAMAQPGSLADKLRERKPDSVRDRYVKLTRAECDALDAVAAGFQASGNTGPVIYSATTLRKRLAAAWT